MEITASHVIGLHGWNIFEKKTEIEAQIKGCFNT